MDKKWETIMPDIELKQLSVDMEAFYSKNY